MIRFLLWLIGCREGEGLTVNEPHTDDRNFSAESILDRIAAEVADEFKLSSLTFECEDDRQDALASAGLEAKRRFGLSDEELSYVRDSLSDLIPASVRTAVRGSA